MEPKGAKNTTIGTQTAKNFQASGSAPVSVINSLQKNPEIGTYQYFQKNDYVII